MTKKLFLALDQGGQSSRALVIDNSGRVMAQAVEPVKTVTPNQGWVEQEPEELVESLLKSTKRVLDTLTPKKRSALHSVALVTQRSTLVCWHQKTGKALYPVISWQDCRAASWLAEQAIDNDWLQKRTGLRLSPHYGASKMRWCLENLDAVKNAYAEDVLCIGPLSSFLVMRLTENRSAFVDPANASRTLLYNIQTHSWDEKLLSTFSIPEKILPKVVASHYDFGVLKIEGLTLPLQIVNGDQSAAFFALGELDVNSAYLNVGTGAFIAACAESMLDVPDSLLKSIVYQTGNESTPASFVIEGTVNGAASALSWVQNELNLKDIGEIETFCDETLSPPLFINTVGGLGSPFWRTDIPPTFIGEASPQQKLVAVLESITFLLYVNLQRMQDSGFKPKRLVVSGGLANINSFCRKLADVSEINVWRPKQTEASASGAVYLLAGKPKCWGQNIKGEWFNSGSPEQSALKERFALWCAALEERLSY